MIAYAFRGFANHSRVPAGTKSGQANRVDVTSFEHLAQPDALDFDHPHAGTLL
jgi:hypothetical protein